MVSLGDDKNVSCESDASTEDYGNFETQIVDVDVADSSTSSSGNRVKIDDAEQLHILQSTLPFDDTVMFDDEFATQAVDPDGETQVVNLVGETQVVNFDNEIQEVDVLDSVANNDTQLFDGCETDEVVASDGEGTDMTEVVDDTDGLSDDNSVKRDCNDPAGKVDSQNLHLCTEGSKKPQSKPGCTGGEQHSLGSGLKGFTSIRVASLRASGLAAEIKASQRFKSQSCYALSSRPLKVHDIEQKGISSERSLPNILEGVPPVRALEKHNEQVDGPETGNRCRFRTTARKLFADDALAETKQINDNVNTRGGGDMPSLFNSETELAGLSYIDSQEPGEASQANALDFVDNFLKVNVESDTIDISKSTGGKSRPLLSAKGTQSLAKSANLINTVGERGIFDWDDNREDEGGGEFFRKRKEAFFDGGGRRRRSSFHSKSSRKVDKSRDEKQLCIHERVMGLVFSDSKLVLANSKANHKSTDKLGTHLEEAKVRKNLIKELDKKSNGFLADGTTEIPTDINIQENTEIRFDTQMAAEAMESLSFGARGADNDPSKADEGCNDMLKSFHGPQVQEQTCTRKSKKRTSNFGLCRRRSKLIKAATNQSKEVTPVLSQRSVKTREQCDQLPVKEPKRVQSVAKKHVAENESRNLNRSSPYFVEKRREESTLKRIDVDRNDGCPSIASGDQKSAKKLRIQGKLGTFTPVAHRTRRCAKGDKLHNVKDAASDFRVEENNLTGFYPRGKRTCRKLSSAGREVNGQSDSRITRSKAAILGNSLDLSIKRQTSFPSGASPLSLQSSEVLVQQNEEGKRANDIDLSSILRKVTYQVDTDVGKANAGLEGSPQGRCKPAASASTPVNCVTPVKEASPICMGDEYLKQSHRKSRIRSCLIQEMDSLGPTRSELTSPIKGTRKRKDTSMIRVLFSRHLDGDIVKQQKKILSRLGASVGTSMSDATHFIADEFVRTRNMLEAIAFGKPVVTHLWLESCAQACCHIDEKNYILRDCKKEKEFGFSLPASLARACQNPLLQGRRVLITPNTKPGVEILSCLVRAVHGLAVERTGRTALKDDKIPDELLILSCEEDYAVCVPFLEKGAAVYSSELLLNGIVIQKLEYERHRLFLDHVKRTRSTIWLKKDDSQYRPVTKCK